MLPEVPVFLHSRWHRFLICMAGSHQQHGAERIPIRLVGVIWLLIVLRPGGVGRLVRLGNSCQNLIPPVLHRFLNLSRGQLLLVVSRFSIRGDAVESISVFLRPLLDDGFPVVRIVPCQCSGVDVKSHKFFSFFVYIISYSRAASPCTSSRWERSVSSPLCTASVGRFQSGAISAASSWRFCSR